MAIKLGPYCVACADGNAITDVTTGDVPCRGCGAPGVVYVDPYDECECELCWASWEDERAERDAWERGVDPEHIASEDRWLELFGVS